MHFVYSGSTTSTLLGYAYTYNYNNYQDSANIRFYSGHSFSNSYTVVLNNTPPSVGTRVGKTGASTGSSSGTVEHNNYTSVVSGRTCYELIKTTLMTDGGDSGGPLFIDNGTRRNIYGIVKSGNKVDMSVFTATKNIN